MTALKSLTFTTVPKIGVNPTLDRRAKVIERLEEQKLLLADPTHKRTIRTTVKKDGERTTVEKQQRVVAWWRAVPNGTYAFFIRVGFKPIEFAKDKTAIAVPSPGGHRYFDLGSTEWRVGRAVDSGGEASHAKEGEKGRVKWGRRGAACIAPRSMRFITPNLSQHLITGVGRILD